MDLVVKDLCLSCPFYNCLYFSWLVTLLGQISSQVEGFPWARWKVNGQALSTWGKTLGLRQTEDKPKTREESLGRELLWGMSFKAPSHMMRHQENHTKLPEQEKCERTQAFMSLWFADSGQAGSYRMDSWCQWLERQNTLPFVGLMSLCSSTFW